MHDELERILASDLPAQDDPAKLADLLYDRCYTRSILDQPGLTEKLSGGRAAKRDLTAALIAANRSRPAWDEGWRVSQVLDDGRIVARKGGAARPFLPGDYVTYLGVGSGPKVGCPIRVFMAAGTADFQQGYYYAFGETVSECAEDEALLRIYWNVSAEGAPCLLEAVTRAFNRYQVPFRFKCLTDAADYPRRDAGVLYLNRRYYPIAALLVERFEPEVRPWLSPRPPLFAKELSYGIGLAEDPGDSFGKHRCAILAEAMTASRGRPVVERLAEVRRQFDGRGLSFDQPWLNAGSPHLYEFPFA